MPLRTFNRNVGPMQSLGVVVFHEAVGNLGPAKLQIVQCGKHPAPKASRHEQGMACLIDPAGEADSCPSRPSREAVKETANYRQDRIKMQYQQSRLWKMNWKRCLRGSFIYNEAAPFK